MAVDPAAIEYAIKLGEGCMKLAKPNSYEWGYHAGYVRALFEIQQGEFAESGDSSLNNERGTGRVGRVEQ